MTDPLEVRTRLLDHAKAVVTDRNDTYGDPLADFRRIAAMWTALFGTPIDPHQVAMAMACLKLSRMVEAPGHRDNWLDLAGYAACGWHCATEATDV